MADSNQYIFTPIESLSPNMWDSMLDQQEYANYNQLLNQPAELAGGFDSSSISSPSSEASSNHTSSWRTSWVVAEVKGAIPDKVERRREQNRQSQRAYRDRKEKHQRELEAQIATWKAKHEKLVQSYAAQSQEISQLNAQIKELKSQILSLQPGVSDGWPSADTPPDFDLVPFFDRRE